MLIEVDTSHRRLARLTRCSLFRSLFLAPLRSSFIFNHLFYLSFSEIATAAKCPVEGCAFQNREREKVKIHIDKEHQNLWYGWLSQGRVKIFFIWKLCECQRTSGTFVIIKTEDMNLIYKAPCLIISKLFFLIIYFHFLFYLLIFHTQGTMSYMHRSEPKFRVPIQIQT
jgi:hypothetical protein